MAKDLELRNRHLRMALLAAEFMTPGEIAGALNEELELTDDQIISSRSVADYIKSKKGRRVVKFLIEKISNNLTRIPISKKAVRLQRLERVFREAMTERLKSVGRFGEVWEVKLGAAIDAIAKAREEMEGKDKHYHFGDGNKLVFQDIEIKQVREMKEEDLDRLIFSRLSQQFEKK